jgi:diguanylate cyclase (GGDEF)-like protein
MRPRPRHAWSKARLLVSLLAWLFPLLAFAQEQTQITAKDLEGPFSIQGQWHFKPGDNLTWAARGYDDSQWSLVEIHGRWPGDGHPEHGQMAWYRKSLQLAPNAMLRGPGFDNGLGVQIGRILSAYELYANGRLIGGAGKLPPMPVAEWGEHKVHFVPRELIGADGRLELALRVWGGSDTSVSHWGGGPYGGPFRVGDYRDLLLGNVTENTPSLLLCGVFLAFGLNHLYLYRRNRQLNLYLWFGLTSINVAVYSLMITQWKFLLPMSFQTLKTLEFGSAYLLPIFALQMTWSLLGMSVRPWMRAYQLGFLVFFVLAILKPWPDTHAVSLNVYQILVIPILFLMPILLWKAMRAGNSEVRTLFLGLIIFGVTCVSDILIDLMRLETPRTIHYGFAAVMISMAISVGNRFTAMLNRLEREVEQHTEELREANQQLSLAARIDPLTGLLNRRGFMEDGEREIQRVNRGGESFALVLADIDHFKSINDIHGHDCGDQLLRRMASLFQQRLRDIDIVGRWGGEEFIFVLPETDARGAAVVAEHLRVAAEAANFQYGGATVPMTVTFGISQHARGDTLEATITRADHALYQGKAAGRNRVIKDGYTELAVAR